MIIYHIFDMFGKLVCVTPDWSIAAKGTFTRKYFWRHCWVNK